MNGINSNITIRAGLQYITAFASTKQLICHLNLIRFDIKSFHKDIPHRGVIFLAHTATGKTVWVSISGISQMTALAGRIGTRANQIVEPDQAD